MPRFTDRQVRQVVEAAVGAAATKVQHLPVGYGNENWRVDTTSARYVLKLGPPESAAKWAATHDVYRLGRAAGLPVPELVHFDRASATADGWTTRLFTWMEGEPAATVLAHRRPADLALFADLGTLARTLHSLPVERFSSRLDGSAPTFDRWRDYVAARLPQVLERVARTAAFGDGDLASVVSHITELASAVDDEARPAICHRDLHLDNVLATPAARVAALLDFDGAEAWDPAIDVVKLRWLVFPHFPGSEDAFLATYGSPPRWAERVRLCELVELLNAVPNAIAAGDTSFESSARTRLQQVLGS